jgi:hypothetical protein
MRKEGQWGMSDIYWPGTSIVKSHGNAFDWRNYGSTILRDKRFQQSETAKKNSAGTGTDTRKQFTIYSRARKMS